MQIIKLIFRTKWKCLELGNGRERKTFFQSLTKVAWKKKSEYCQQEWNLWPSGPGCSKDGYRYPSYKKSIRETNCAIQWIVIYLVDSALDLSNIWRLVISPHAVHWATGDSWKLLFILLELTYISSTQTFRKQTTFRDATNGFPAKWRLRKERRNSILMTRYLGSASDWLRQISQSGTTNQKQHPDLGSDASLVGNFFTCFSDVFSRGNGTFINVVWWNRLLSYIFTKRLRCSCCLCDTQYFADLRKLYFLRY